MKDALTSLLTLIIMLLGLAMMVGGPRAVRFLFAPFIAGLQAVFRLIFVLLVIYFIAVAALNGNSSQQSGVADPQPDTSTNEITPGSYRNISKEARKEK